MLLVTHSTRVARRRRPRSATDARARKRSPGAVKPFSPLLLRAGLRYLLRHRWQGLLALSGIALGVAVVLAVNLANSGARAAFELSAQQLQGKATHRLAIPGATLPDAVYVDLRRQPGAPPMAPVVDGWIRVEGDAGRYHLVGFDLFAEAPFRNALAEVADVAGFTTDWLTQSRRTGARRRLPRAGSVSRRAMRWTLFTGASRTGCMCCVSKRSTVPPPADLLLVDIATAKSVLDMQGRLSYVDLILDAAGEHWVRQRIPPGVQLQTVAAQAQGVTRLSAAFELNLTAMSLLALLVGMFLIFNAMTFSMVQRRNLFGRLRAIGVTPRELFNLVLLEAAVVAVAGTALGLMFGVWLGRALTRLVAATVSDLYYNVSVNALHLDWTALLSAAGLGVGATLLATLAARLARGAHAAADHTVAGGAGAGRAPRRAAMGAAWAVVAERRTAAGAGVAGRCRHELRRPVCAGDRRRVDDAPGDPPVARTAGARRSCPVSGAWACATWTGICRAWASPLRH